MKENLTPFPCDACGLCCRQVGNSEQTTHLDRGDGVCQHFDDETYLCKIYESRPLVCRVEDYYKRYLAQTYQWETFVEMNVEICQRLKKQKK